MRYQLFLSLFLQPSPLKHLVHNLLQPFFYRSPFIWIFIPLSRISAPVWLFYSLFYYFIFQYPTLLFLMFCHDIHNFLQINLKSVKWLKMMGSTLLTNNLLKKICCSLYHDEKSSNNVTLRNIGNLNNFSICSQAPGTSNRKCVHIFLLFIYKKIEKLRNRARQVTCKCYQLWKKLLRLNRSRFSGCTFF